MDKKGALEVLCLAQDLYGFDASGGRRVIFFQDVAISIPMLQWIVLQNYSHAQTASTKWTVVLKKTIHNVWRKRWRWKVENELERRDSGFYKKQLHECIKFLKSGVFKNKVKLKKKTGL